VLNAELAASHGLTVSDYEVLLHLSRAPNMKLKRVDLAGHLLLTPSGVTRLLDGLQKSGYVCKAACEGDARVTYAVLTDAGLEKLKQASVEHLESIHSHFAGRFSDEEIDTLSELLGRLQGCGGASAADRSDCSPPD
jgi:DNA-binding MarR family transcriptional regulator